MVVTNSVVCNVINVIDVFSPQITCALQETITSTCGHDATRACVSACVRVTIWTNLLTSTPSNDVHVWGGGG